MDSNIPDGFRRIYEPASVATGYKEFLSAMRNVLDLSICADSDEPTVWKNAGRIADELAELLARHQVEGGPGIANRAHGLPGLGSLLLPPWIITERSSDSITMSGRFTRFHLGGNDAAHGGVIPLLFDWLLAATLFNAGRPVSRTARLEVSYKRVTPIDTPLLASGRVDEVTERKTRASAEIRDESENTLATCTALFVALKDGQA